MKFLCVEDHPLAAIGLRIVLSKFFHGAMMCHAETVAEALSMLEREHFELAFLDIDIPGTENVLLIQRMREKQPGLPILIQSTNDEKVYALLYLQAGADGFITKQAPEHELCNAVRSILDHGRYVSYEVQQTFLTSLTGTRRHNASNPIVALSPRERRVMQLMTEGKWTKEIAAILNLKENTISTYKRRIFDKMDVKDPVELSKKIALLQ